MEIVLIFVWVAVGFFLLIKGADLLVDGSSSAAKKMRFSELMIGLTVVAFGTSAPEMVVNVISSYKGLDDVIFGNVIGSNIFNLLMILGIAGFIYPMSVTNNTVWKEIPFSILITMVLFILVSDHFLWNAAQNQISQIDGILLLALFVGFLIYVFKNLRENEINLLDDVKIFSNKKTVLYIITGIIFLSIGGHLVVKNAENVAHYFNVSDKLIGLTIISAGTSLPELATSVVAALKRKADIAIGNVLGSNIFNITLVLSVSSLISPIQYKNVFDIDMTILLISTMLLFFFMFTLTVKKLDRWEAFIFIIGFLGYMIFLFIRK